MDFVDTIFFSLRRRMMVLNKASSVQSKKNTERSRWNNNNGNSIKKRQQKINRMPSSLKLSSLSFRRAATSSLAIIYFHVLIVNGSELTTVQPPRTNMRMQEQTESSESATGALRNVRREVLLEEAFMYTDFFGTDDLTTVTTGSPAIPSTQSATPITSDLSEEQINSGDYVESDLSLDSSEDDNSFYNATDDISELRITSDLTNIDDIESDFFFNGTDDFVEETEGPSETSSASPSETNFLPVAVLEEPEDPIEQLVLAPTNEPTDIKTSERIDQTQVPTSGFLHTRSGPPTNSNAPTTSSAPTVTSEPTRAPFFSDIIIVNPTERPTEEPTRVPTSTPTRKPTFMPTRIPTGVPTNVPTVVPTRIPTGVPTGTPTRAPTRVPTNIPTLTPTFSPTNAPSRRPTRAPTSAPTSTPSSTPSIQPTRIPTHLPTRNPTKMPTKEPTSRPSTSPTQDPTPSGTFEPSMSLEPSVTPSISNEPTYSPTGRPSASPTMSPTLPLQTGDARGNMKLQPVTEKLRGRDILLWETVTERFIKEFLQSNQIEPPMILDDIRANLELQTIFSEDIDSTAARFLQQANSDTSIVSLVIQFDLLVQYRSISNDYDINQLVWSAFDSPDKEAEYILDLQQQLPVFVNVTETKVDVEGFIPPLTQAPQPVPGKNIDIAVIVGASVGVVAFIILIILVFLRRRSGKSIEERGVTQTLATPSTTKNIKVSTEILVEPQDDVSTLGDPMFGQGGMIMSGIERDEMTATYVFLYFIVLETQIYSSISSTI